MSGKEINQLVLENARLRKDALPHCRGCARLEEDYTGTFHLCKYLGSVDPDKDGCSRRCDA